MFKLYGHREDGPGGSHSGAGCLVDNHRLAAWVHVVFQAEVGGHAVQEHAVVRGHRGELPSLASARKRSRKSLVGNIL